MVLRTIPYSETSLIAVLFSRQIGRLSTIAKGARRPGKAAASALQPTHDISCIVYVGTGGGLKTISQIELVADRPGITRSATLFGLAGRALELALSQTPLEEASPNVYHLLNELLTTLEKASQQSGQQLLLAYELKLQGILGYGLRVNSCARCGRAAGKRSIALSPSAGGILCETCRGGVGDVLSLEREELSVLRAMLTDPIRVWLRNDIPSMVLTRLGFTARRIWELHSPLDRSSSSAAFLAEVGSALYSPESSPREAFGH